MPNKTKQIIRRMKSPDHVSLLLDQRAWRDALLRLRPANPSMEDARRLARWRSDHTHAFLTWIRPSPEEVLEWLNAYQDREDDILFIIETFEGSAWGQIGLYRIDLDQGTAELGRLIRGEDAPDGMMFSASLAVLEWAFEQLQLQEVVLEIFEDHVQSVAFYRKLGFLRRDSYPVRKCSENGKIVRWIPLEPGLNGFEGPRRMVCRMVLIKERFRKLHGKSVLEIRKGCESSPVCSGYSKGQEYDFH